MASRQGPAQQAPDAVVGSFRIGKEIGRGSFATVFQGVHSKTKSLVAIKSVLRSKLNRKLLENLESEIQILKTLNHPHIVALLDCQKSASYIHLVMEYCSMGDLSMFIKRRDRLHSAADTAAMAQKYPSPSGGGLNEVIVRHFLKQLASALEFLRSKNLIHRDVKPQNLLLEPPVVTYDERGPYGEAIIDTKRQIPEVGLADLPILKIADFGFARSLPSTSLAETLCGSPLYMAPEILRYEKYDAKADLWSVGTVLYEMVVGKPPFRANNHVELLRRIEKGEDKIRFPEDCSTSSDIRRLIRSLLKRNPVERLGFADFFADPVITGDIPGAILAGRRTDEPRPARDGQGLDAAGRSDSRGSEQPIPEYFPQRQLSRGPSTSPQMAQNAAAAAAIREAKQLSPSPFPDSERVPSRRGVDVAAARQTVGRTASAVPLSPKSLSREAARPSLAHATSAPARPTEKPSTGLPMERQISQQTASPGSSFLVQRQLQQGKPSPRETREARERAEQDSLVEREYVVIEKRTVEVNAFADEIAQSPQITGRNRTPSSTPPQSSAGAVARRIPQSPSPSRTVATKRTDAHGHKGSYERSIGSSPGSAASSALAKALTMAKNRLNPIGFLPPSVFGTYNTHNVIPQYPQTGLYPAGSVVVISGGTQTASPIGDDDSNTILAIEEAANRSEVVYQFAEIKLQQLIPVGPGAQQAGSASEVSEDAELTPEAVVSLSEEALVLYVKTLSLLARAMDIASSWWAATNGDLSPHQISTTRIAASAKMNNAVQWVRERFNEVLEKADFVRNRLVEAQKALPASHPSHPSNHPEASSLSLASNSDRVIVSPGISAEKLMYERALEMSRMAAVNELVGEDLTQCEQAYVTAIWMLEGVLEADGISESGTAVSGREEFQGPAVEEEDRKVVEKFLLGIRGRLTQLRKKMATISRRSSGVQSIHTHGATSPSPPYATPVAS